MKKKNIIALCLGIIAAGLLWHYYLKPKYDIKTGNPKVAAELLEADFFALRKATEAVGGQVLFTTEGEDVVYDVAEDGSSVKDDVLSARNTQPQDFDFISTANKETTIFDLASAPDKKPSVIAVSGDDIIMHPTIITEEAAPLEEGTEPGERISMIIIPASPRIIKTEADYSKYKKEQGPDKYPAVNFGRDMIIFLESPQGLSGSFFEVASVADAEGKIIIDYRANILGNAERGIAKAYSVQKKSNKKVEVKQIK